MFKFSFDLEDTEGDVNNFLPPDVTQKDLDSKHVERAAFSELPLSQLLDSLPEVISFSPLSIPLSVGGTLTLARRDLFDVRFQLISQSGYPEEESRPVSSGSHTSALKFVEAPSDVVPGVYEGGLKTWECSLDLVDYLGAKSTARRVRGQRVLEVGCGTAIPTLYLLHQLFSSPPSDEETHFHLQDYNSSVLELVSFPNLLLAWYISPSSKSYRKQQNTESANTLDPFTLSELPITPELKSAFLFSLSEHKITLRFFSGSWNTFDITRAGGHYDVVLTSETIYHQESIPSLIRLMYSACRASENTLEGLTASQLTLSPKSVSSCLCLVAAKVIYFGVGGGVPEFLATLESMNKDDRSPRADVENVWTQKTGVNRVIMQIHWEQW